MSNIRRRPYTDKKTGKRKLTKMYYGRVKTPRGWKEKPLSPNAEIAKKKLRKLELEAEAERAGLPTASGDHANRLLLDHLDDFLADKTNEGVKASTVTRWRTRFNALFAFTGWKLLREINGPKAQEHLAGLVETRSAKTLEDLKGDYATFGRWLVRAKRYSENVFADLRNPSRGMESVRKPRAFTEAELLAVMAAAEAGRPFKSIPGPRRVLLYKLACFTGLRADELGTMTAGQVETDDVGRVFVNVRAGLTKSKKTARQAVPDNVAGDLLALAAGLAPTARLFPGSWRSHAAAMIQADAKAAGVETVSETPQGRRVLTFHSLRHSFALWLKTSGIPLTLAQLMMRHADVKLTTATYGQIDDATLHQAVQGIAGKGGAAPLTHPLTHGIGDERRRLTTNTLPAEAGEGQKCLENAGIGDEGERLATGEKMEWKRIELSTDSQNPLNSPALPASPVSTDKPTDTRPAVPPDLAELISLWPAVPADIRASVLVLIRAGLGAAGRPPAITARRAAG